MVAAFFNGFLYNCLGDGWWTGLFLTAAINQTLQNRFHPDIRSRFRILACDPDWTNFSRSKKKRRILRF